MNSKDALLAMQFLLWFSCYAQRIAAFTYAAAASTGPVSGKRGWCASVIYKAVKPQFCTKGFTDLIVVSALVVKLVDLCAKRSEFESLYGTADFSDVSAYGASFYRGLGLPLYGATLLLGIAVGLFRRSSGFAPSM